MRKLNRDIQKNIRFAFKQHAFFFGLHPRMLDKDFMFEGKEYRIAGLRLLNRDLPVMARNLKDRQLYVFPASVVAKAVNANEVPAGV